VSFDPGDRAVDQKLPGRDVGVVGGFEVLGVVPVQITDRHDGNEEKEPKRHNGLIGLLALVLLASTLRESDAAVARRKRFARQGDGFDLVGFALVATFLGALEIALDRGLEDDCFGSNFIVAVVAVCAVAFMLMIPWELSRVIELINPSTTQYQDTLQQVTNYFAAQGASLAQAQQQAFTWIAQQVQTQAAYLAYIDVFWALMVISAAAALLALTLRKVKLGGPAPVAH
jgi:hypothetical protein